MPRKKAKIFVAMSGGVDSSVSAALLKKAGFLPAGRQVDVVGVHMKCWSSELSRECTASEDEHSARMAAAHLGIPFYVWNFVAEYKRRVVDYMLEGYEQGLTPNPDIMCNKEIKFGLFFEKAIKLGADYVATGHYARIARHNATPRLLQGVDKEKDQSYFLSFIKPEVLDKILFPVGNYTKPQVRALARKFGLPNAERKDSQGICFVGEVAIGDFLRQYIKPKKGDIVDTQGRKLSEHDGVFYYTVGQRKGIGLAGGPWYIGRKDVKKNELVVSKQEQDLYASTATIENVHWLGEPAHLPATFRAHLRYRHAGARAELRKEGDGYVLAFAEPQRAVTPGQFAAFYVGDQLLGGGVIRC